MSHVVFSTGKINESLCYALHRETDNIIKIHLYEGQKQVDDVTLPDMPAAIKWINDNRANKYDSAFK